MIQGLYPIFDHWHKQGTLWIFSDPHFNDPELKYIEDRNDPEEQVRKINSKVGKKDTLICLGDVGDIAYAKLLKGYKILICGNHDAGISNYQRKKATLKFPTEDYPEAKDALAAAKKIYPNCTYHVTEGFNTSHYPFTYWQVIVDNNLFDEVYTGPLLIGEKLILSHEPLNLDWAFNIHGHVHNSIKYPDPYHFNVCGEATSYYPVNMNQWMKEGHLKVVQSIHRETINKATFRKQKKERGIKHEDKSNMQSF